MNWNDLIKTESEQEYFKILGQRVQEDSKQFEIYPPHNDIFNAFKFCPLDQVRAVLLAQDPYFNPGQAHGLSFSVQPGVVIPPSLRNIFKELKDDVGVDTPANGCLTGWAKQGILLLNSCLTVRRGEPNSHAKFGWQTFTDKIISVLNEKDSPIVFLLWGANARSKKSLISNERHLILESAHPSPLSAHNGFFWI